MYHQPHGGEMRIVPGGSVPVPHLYEGGFSSESGLFSQPHFVLFVYFLRIYYWAPVPMYVRMYAYVCVFVCMCVLNSAHGNQKKLLEWLDRELQVVVSRKIWILGIECESSARAAGMLLTPCWCYNSCQYFFDCYYYY